MISHFSESDYLLFTQLQSQLIGIHSPTSDYFISEAFILRQKSIFKLFRIFYDVLNSGRRFSVLISLAFILQLVPDHDA